MIVERRTSEIKLKRKSKQKLQSRRSYKSMINDENNGNINGIGGSSHDTDKKENGSIVNSRRALVEIAWWTVTPNASDMLQNNDNDNNFILYRNVPHLNSSNNARHSNNNDGSLRENKNNCNNVNPKREPPQHIKDQEATSQGSSQSSPSMGYAPLGMETLHPGTHQSHNQKSLPDIERLKLETGPISPTPYSASSTGILKQLDQSTNASRLASRAPSRAPSVAGIGKTAAKPDYSEAKIVVAMVGLPARGKSYLSNKLMRYLKWLEYDVKVFNVGQYRRKLAREKKATTGTRDDHSASFFNPNNSNAAAMREQMANDCLENLIEWLRDGGNVGIHDATNSTAERRQKLADRINKERGMQILFVESICDDPAVVASNVAGKVSAGDPDYNGMTPEQAEADFRRRISHYEAAYEPVHESHLSSCKVINVGQKVQCNLINGYLQSRIAFYLMNLHVSPRSIYLTRHGESMHNVSGRIGGDSDLSPRGQRYAQALPNLVRDNVGDVPLTLWTSTLKRTIQTAANLPYPKLTWKSLDELDAGVCDNLTYEEIEANYPDDYANRDEDKYNYRYRGGESYRDVVIRLEPIIMEMERQSNVLVICHQAILRCIYGYFHNIPQEEIPYIKIPLHTVIKLTPKAYGCDEVRYQLPIEAVDTHRPKPLKRSDSKSSSASKK